MEIPCRGSKPQLAADVFVADGARIVGDVIIGAQSSIWFNAVIRGDVAPIRIGSRSNIQDNAVVHGTWHKAAATIGNGVTIGHSVILHGCTIGDNCLIGMGTIVMDQAEIPANCIVGAGSLVTEGSQFPEGSLILGRPAKVIRPLKPAELEFLPKSAANYMTYTGWYDQK
jgi:carbonic anhydrase/acetyltransferase-like protein (isoleucine patch superfamily)